MLQDNRIIGVSPDTPGIVPEIEGAPVTVPGSGDGMQNGRMEGRPVMKARFPSPVSVDLPGVPVVDHEIRRVEASESSESKTSESESEDKEDRNSPFDTEVPNIDATRLVPSPYGQVNDDKKKQEPMQVVNVYSHDKGGDGTLKDEENLKREREEAVAGSDRQIRTIQDWLDAEENRPETEEQRKKRERREKSKRVMAALSDGISALSNLFFTTQYAPNMYNHERGSQLNATNERIERLKAEREKKRDEYLNFSLKLGDLENDRAKTLRELEAQQEARKLAREKAEREAKKATFEESLWPDKRREQTGKADKAGYEAQAAQAEAEYAPQLQEAKLDTEKARAGAQRASATAARASAANSYASARSHDRSNRNEFYGTGRNGKEYSFATEKAAIDFEHRQGTYNPSKWGHDVVEETTVTGRETSKGGKTTKKRNTYPQKKMSPTAGGGAGKKSPTA